MRTQLKRLSLVAVLGLVGCASLPSGPTMVSMPGSGRSFEQFQADDGACRQYAYQQVGGQTAQTAATNSAVASAAVGTAVGAAAGALIDGSSGAGVGAGMGLITGSLIGLGYADASGYGTQQRYDYAYYQCMYAKGHKVPVSGRVAASMRSASQPSSAPYPPRANQPPPNAAVPPPNAPPPNAAIPPPNAPPPPGYR